MSPIKRSRYYRVCNIAKLHVSILLFNHVKRFPEINVCVCVCCGFNGPERLAGRLAGRTERLNRRFSERQGFSCRLLRAPKYILRNERSRAHSLARSRDRETWRGRRRGRTCVQLVIYAGSAIERLSSAARPSRLRTVAEETGRANESRTSRGRAFSRAYNTTVP